MKICVTCGREFNDNANFCTNCASPLQPMTQQSAQIVSCSHCGTMNDASMGICVKCGTVLAAGAQQPRPAQSAQIVSCSHCGTMNDASMGICVKCGTVLEAPVRQPRPAQAPSAGSCNSSAGRSIALTALVVAIVGYVISWVSDADFGLILGLGSTVAAVVAYFRYNGYLYKGTRIAATLATCVISLINFIEYVQFYGMTW